MFKIVPTNLHWIVPLPATEDLCAHGGVIVTLGEEVLLEATPGDYAVSTGALHLLRTIEKEHSPEHPIVEHLVPCCGHFMVIDEAGSEAVNLGCMHGVNWWVRHSGKIIILEFPNGRCINLDDEEWRRSVVGFSDLVADFYREHALKRPECEDDLHWWPVFQAEWERRHVKAKG